MQWRSVVGYEGLYEVSDTGLVRSLTRQTSRGTRKGKILKPTHNKKSGYPYVNLHGTDGSRRNVTVHSIVCRAFLGDRPEDGWQIRHLDGDPRNCTLSNLKYGTPSDNAYDKVRHGRNHNAEKIECVNGHLFNEENTMTDPATGHRACRKCSYRNSSAYKKRKREATNS